MFCSWSHWNRYVQREIQENQITWQSHDTSHDSHVMCGGLTLVCSFLSCLWHSQIPSGPTPSHKGTSFLSWNGKLIIGENNQSWNWYTKNCCMCVRTCILLNRMYMYTLLQYMIFCSLDVPWPQRSAWSTWGVTVWCRDTWRQPHHEKDHSSYDSRTWLVPHWEGKERGRREEEREREREREREHNIHNSGILSSD